MILTITIHRSDKLDQPLIKLNANAERGGVIKWMAAPDGDLIELTDTEIIRYRAFDFSFIPVVIREPRIKEVVTEEAKPEVLMTGRKFRLTDKNL